MKNDLSSYRKKTKRQMFFLYKVLPALLVSILTQAMFIYWNQGKIPFPLPITEIIEFIFTFLYFLGLFWIYPKISKLAYSRMMERFRSWQVNIMESLAVVFSTLAFTAIIKILPLFLILLVMDHFFDTSWQFDNVALRRSFIVHAIIGLLLYFFVEREKVQKRIRREHLRHTQLQREEFKHELENLKKQVNPEFLFSSLKSLEPLILNRPEKANKFVGRLSYLYRSFLENKEQLVPLKKEIELANAYFDILKQRQQENFSVEWDIKKTAFKYQLPPYSLQMLFEAILNGREERALNINITTENDEVVVDIEISENGIEINHESEDLKTLNKNYAYLTDRKPEFFKTNSDLVAKLPLLIT